MGIEDLHLPTSVAQLMIDGEIETDLGDIAEELFGANPLTCADWNQRVLEILAWAEDQDQAA